MCALSLYCGFEKQWLLPFAFVLYIHMGTHDFLFFFLMSGAGFESLVGGIESLYMPPLFGKYLGCVFKPSQHF